MGAQAAIGLGSNLASAMGDRRANLAFALESLQRTRGIAVVRVSRWHETAPVGPGGQGPYLNGAAVITTTHGPSMLLAMLHAIEAAAGRNRRVERRWGARTLDLDLLLYGDRIVRVDGVDVPHPRMTERSFVLAPLAEAAPGWRHPETGLTAAAMLRRLLRRGRRSSAVPRGRAGV